MAEPEPPADPGLSLVRGLSAICGVVLLVGAAALYIAPVEVGEHWPWALTPLLGRAVASWYALIGAMLVSCAWGSPVDRGGDPVRRSRPGACSSWRCRCCTPTTSTPAAARLVAWLVVMLALLALAVLALGRSMPRLRDEGL